MNAKRVKIFSILMAVLLIMLSICGCGSDIAQKSSGGYTANCVDEAGNPVEGAGIQFCDESSCSIVNSDASGKAVYEGTSASYEVHAIKAPKGYEVVTTDTITVTSPSDELSFVFKKSAQ